MGCWNETCGITQLPICYGDKARVFILVNQESWKFADNKSKYTERAGGGTCYSNEIWSPMGPPIQGTYDDYGSLENLVENENTKILLDQIKEGWVEFKSEFEKVSPIKKMKLSEVLHWIERDRAHINLPCQGKKALGIMMVLEEVYQTMIKFDPIHHHVLSYGPDCIAFYKPFSESIKEEFKEWYMNAVDLFEEHKDNPFTAALQVDFDGNRFFFESSKNGVGQYRHMLMKLAESNASFEDKRVQNIVAAVMEMTMFNSSMSATRKMWHPQCGKGSQDSELDLYDRLNKTITQIIKEREAKDLEDGGEIRDANGYFPWQLEHNIKEQERYAKEGK